MLAVLFSNKAGQATGAPGLYFTPFMPFICVHLRHLWIAFSCLGFFSCFSVKVFSCGYAALCYSWLRYILRIPDP